MTISVVEIASIASSAYDLVKTKNRSRKRIHKVDGIGVGRIRSVPFSSDSAYDSVAYNSVKTRLSESEAEADERANHNIRAQSLQLLSASINKHRGHGRDGSGGCKQNISK